MNWSAARADGRSPRRVSLPSMQRRAARYVEAGARDVGGVVGEQERDRMPYVVGRGRAPERAAGRFRVGRLPARFGIAGGDGVDPDAERTDLLRERLAEHD